MPPQPWPQQPPPAPSKPELGIGAALPHQRGLHKRIPAEGIQGTEKSLYQNIDEALSLDTELYL